MYRAPSSTTRAKAQGEVGRQAGSQRDDFERIIGLNERQHGFVETQRMAPAWQLRR